MTFDYYSFPFCINGPVKTFEKSLGEILTGDVIRTSFYQMNALEGVECRKICSKEYSVYEKKKFFDAIEDETKVNM